MYIEIVICKKNITLYKVKNNSIILVKVSA